MELRQIRAIREADPPLRESILRRCERLDADLVAPIFRELDEVHPAVVLEAHFQTLAPNGPTIGAVLRRRELR